MHVGQKMARTAHVTDQVCKQLRLFNNPAYNAGDFNAVAKIIYDALEATQQEQP